MSNPYTKEYNSIVRELRIKVVFIYPTENPQPLSQVKHIQVDAVIDSGSTDSVITQKVVDALTLPLYGEAISVAINSQNDTKRKTSPTYRATIILPDWSIITKAFTQCENLGENVDALIGMDIITMGDFAITNTDNKTTLTFRIPSVKKIDFKNNE